MHFQEIDQADKPRIDDSGYVVAASSSASRLCPTSLQNIGAHCDEVGQILEALVAGVERWRPSLFFTFQDFKMVKLRNLFSTSVAALALTCSAAVSFPTLVSAQETLNVYGPGGPAPAMKDAAKAFGDANKVTVNVVAGPTPQWVDKAKQDADVIFSGAENMFNDFAKALPGAFELRDAQPLYLRPVAILVRPGNPKKIRGFRDLLKPGVKVLTVAGAGQTGLWEDVAGRTGDISMVRAFRKNMVFPEAANSAAAKDQWTHKPILMLG